VNTIFITGSGKAFVGGADVKFFVSNMKSDMICNIETFTGFGQQVFNKIDRSSKIVVAVVNGLTLGGGLELALCADLILALPKAQFAFPETGIGIYPGLGGTQRSVQRIGKGLSKYMIHTGKKLSAEEAFQIGLIDKVISPGELSEILYGNGQLPDYVKPNQDHKWIRIRNCFEENTLENILNNNITNRDFTNGELEKITKAMAFKAPVALRIADQLIDEAKGCESELEHIREIFSTKDALLGLTSIGKPVTYSGE
jgi:enoyl-CoA hydratase/3-hydroxyacyl-CoA dehydrogenase